MNIVNQLVKDYHTWLKDNTVIQEIKNSDWTMIGTPFIGAFNDLIDIYVKIENDSVHITDGGDTLNNLDLLGYNLTTSKKRRFIADSILMNYGVGIENNELIIKTNLRKFPQSKHNFITAILELNDLYVLSKPNVTSIFKEDVKEYLDSLNIVYTQDFISRGKIGIEFVFDFQIARKNDEVVIKSFNKLNRANLSSFLFSWNDIKPSREKLTGKTLKSIAVINDIDNYLKEDYLKAFEYAESNTILWSAKNTEISKAKILG